MLREHRTRAHGLPDLLNFAALVDEGVVLNKDGSFLTAWWYAGPDMESASTVELAALSSRVNAALLRLGNGWMLQSDAIRRPSAGYAPPGAFPDATTAVVDAERRAQYENAGAGFESLYALTAVWLPPRDVQDRVAGWFVDEPERRVDGYEGVLRAFVRSVEEIEDALAGALTLARMNSGDLLSFLHYCVTTDLQDIRVPGTPMYLDALLGSRDLVGGFKPRVGTQRLCAIALIGFPGETFPQILSGLGQLSLSFRWSNRFVSLDPATAEARLRVMRRNWFQKRQGLSGLLKQALSLGEPTFSNRDAVAMAEDADEAVQEAASGAVRFGYFTSVVLLAGSDEAALDAAARQVRRLLQHCGFASRVEEMNALEAYLGTIPGHGHRNLRRPLVHTLNFADLIPTTSVWPGLETNPSPLFAARSPALLYARTSGATPFRLNLHVSDVGHTLVIGPTGSGKTTLIGLLIAQFFRYAGAQVFAFDKGHGLETLVRAATGDHYDLGGESSEGGLALCPLSNIDRPGERPWAAEWLETVVRLQGLTVTPEHRRAVQIALERLAESPARSLTDFATTVQDREVRAALRHYTLEGALGALLDAERDGLGTAAFQVFEMERLLNLGDANATPVLTCLFHRIEERLDGQPTLIVIEEAWLALGNVLFAEKLEEWLRVLRKRNAAVVFVSQSLAEVVASPMCALLLESCPTKLLLPNPEARTPQTSSLYQRIGLTNRQIELIASAVPKREYYYASPLGRRLIDLGLGPVALSFVGAASPEELREARALQVAHGTDWPAAWLSARGVSDWAALWQELKGET